MSQKNQMASQTYVNLPLVIATIEKRLGVEGVKYEAVERVNNRGSKYHVLNFTRADNTPIVSYVYAKPNKDTFMVLAKSFKERMTKRDQIVEVATTEELEGMLF